MTNGGVLTIVVAKQDVYGSVRGSLQAKATAFWARYFTGGEQSSRVIDKWTTMAFDGGIPLKRRGAIKTTIRRNLDVNTVMAKRPEFA